MDDWRYDPAHDLELPPLQRWKSVRRESGLLEVATQSLWWGAVRGYLKAFHRMRVVGREHLPAKPPFIVVANHESHLDALVVASALPPRLRRVVLPVAAGDVFFVAPLIAAFAAACLNALPLWRKNAGRHALDQLRQRLIEEPCGYILFPAGGRSRDGGFLPFRPGIGMMVAGADVPVVPCYLTGTFESLRPETSVPRPHRIEVRIGTPLRFAEVENCREGWERIARESERAVRALGEREGDEQPQAG